MTQLVINQTVLVTTEFDGVEMGVLADGTPFLTGRGLARICGLAPSAVIQQAQRWLDGQREGRFHSFLVKHGVDVGSLYIKTRHNKRDVHAYPDSISMLILEYYAFEVGNDIATQSYRVLARSSLRQYIYARTGYDAARAVPDAWRQFHDRLLLNVVPTGYFSVFREMSDVVLASIRAGLIVDQHCVPDISVGKAWSKHWEDSLTGKRAERIRYDHNYPEYFSQADSNPQPSWAYPIDALGEFRRWMIEEYLPEKFPDYLAGQVKKGTLAIGTARHVLAAVGQSAESLPLPRTKQKLDANPAPRRQLGRGDVGQADRDDE